MLNADMFAENVENVHNCNSLCTLPLPLRESKLNVAYSFLNGEHGVLYMLEIWFVDIYS